MILLFTAVHPRRPFHKRDLLNACCEPIGAQITFGYRRTWLSSNVRDAQLNGESALIVFCEVWEEENDFRFHPVRLVRIVDVASDHDGLALNLEFATFASYERDANQTKKFLEDFSSYVDLSDRPRLRKSDLKSYYVRSEKDYDSSAFGGSWLPFVEHMRTLRGLEDVTFMAAHSGSGASRNPASLMPECVYQNQRATYRVTGGRSQEIVLWTLPGGDAKADLPELVIPDSVASVSGPFIRQRSSGFEVRFELSFLRSFHSENAMLSVRMPLVRANDAIAFVSPEHQALVRVRGSQFTLWLTVALLTVGSFIQAFPFQQVTAAGATPMGIPWTAVLVKLVGATMIAVGAYLGFKRLPIPR